MTATARKPARTKTAPKKRKAAPGGPAAAAAKAEAFAHAFLRLGTASAAFREVNPRARTWKQQSVAVEASRYIRRPAVTAAIERLRQDARLDAIASRGEIARYLADIMRGQETEKRIIQTRDEQTGMMVDKEIEVPPPVSQRIRAARELERMLPAVLPPEPAADAAADEISATLADRLRQIAHPLKKTKAIDNE